MMEVLMILLAISIIGIWAFVVYMNHLNKRIYELGTKIDALQYQTDDVLHDINIMNENVLNNYGLLRRTENEKINIEPNLKNIWHDPAEEPQDDLELIIYKYKDNFWFTIKQNTIKYHGSWKNFIDKEQMILWAYIKDLFPKNIENT